MAIFGRLVSQESFGQFAILHVIMLFVLSISEFGFGASLIQLEKYNKYHVGFAFYASMGIGMMSYVVLFFLAPVISQFYESALSVTSIRVIGLNLIIKSFAIVPVSLLIRNFKFKEIFYSICIAQILGNLILGVYLAYIGMELWALILSLLGINFLISTVSYIMQPHSFIPHFSKKESKEVLNYGTGLTALRLLSQVGNSADKIILGKFFPMASVGIYERALYIATLPKSYLTKSLDGVLFSTLSRLQNDRVKEERTYLNAIAVIGIILLIIGLNFIFYPTELITFILGDKWFNAAPFLQIFGFYTILIVFIRFSDTLIRAKNAVWNSSIIKGIFAILKIVAILSLVQISMKAVAIGSVLVYVIHAAMMIYLVLKITQIRLKDFILNLKPILFIALFVIVKNMVLTSLFGAILPGMWLLIISLFFDTIILLFLFFFQPKVYGRNLTHFIISIASSIGPVDRWITKTELLPKIENRLSR